MSYEHGVIPEFRGEYFFLSNYCVTPFTWRNIEFQSGEQAFAYAKTFFAKDSTPRMVAGRSMTEAEYFQELILEAFDPGTAKRRGRQVTIDANAWDNRKVYYMREIIHAKFMTGQDSNGHGIVGPLVNTGAKMLVEGNDWNDKFWGRCLDKSTGRWVGLNTLGVILMEERGWWSRGDLGRPN